MEVMCGGESESESASLLHDVTFVTLIEPYYVTDVLKSFNRTMAMKAAVCESIGVWHLIS